MRAEILTIGDEILRGEIIDSNKAFLSEQLLDHEIECWFQTSVRDDPKDIRDALRRAVERCEVVLVSGGLGPTRDDITIEVLAETFGRELVLDEASLEALREFFRRLGRNPEDIADNNAKQAWFPVGAEVLANPLGTAPGCALSLTANETGGGEAIICCMPGVPSEMRLMMQDQVLPRVARLVRMAGGAGGSGDDGVSHAVVRARILRTFGKGESALDEELKDLAQSGGVELGFRTSFPDNALRPLVRAATVREAESRLAAVCQQIRERVGDIVYSEDDEPLEAVVGQLLTAEQSTIAVAESCTGGLLAEKLTRVSGSSAYFLGGIVAYANEAKEALLDVPKALLEAHGAVSNEVAVAMAEGARARFGAEFGVSTTGISGPDGGSEEKPVGTVSIAIAREGQPTHVERFVFPLDRERHRVLVAQIGLDWIRRSLLSLELMAPSLLRQRGQSGGSGKSGEPGKSGERGDSPRAPAS